jgi:membrane-associated phospholipid phosphatase
LKKIWAVLGKLELYELVGLIVSVTALSLFLAYGDELDALQGEPGWHYRPVLWIWDIYSQFIPKAIVTALVILVGIGWWKHGSARWGLVQTWNGVRIFLPFCVLLIIYRALNFYIPLFSPVDRDSWLMAADEWIFGVQPAFWLERFIHPVLTDLLSFAYMAWFPMIFFTLLLMMLKSQEAVTSYVTSALFSFYFGYVCYTLVPAVGPLYALQDAFTVALQGGAMTSLQSSVVIQKDMSIPRDVFPSLHTAISCVMLFYVWKYWRKLLWVYAPLVVLILISTVYLRYHYAIDVIAGIALASLMCYFGRKWNLWWRAYREKKTGVPAAPVPADEGLNNSF